MLMCIYKPNKWIYFLIQAYCPAISVMIFFYCLKTNQLK